MWFKLTERPGTTLDVYRGCKTTVQQQHLFVSTLSDLNQSNLHLNCLLRLFCLIVGINMIAIMSKELPVLQIRRGNRDNLGIIRHISQ